MDIKNRENFTLLKWTLVSLIIFMFTLIIYRHINPQSYKLYFYYTYFFFFIALLFFLNRGVKSEIVGFYAVFGVFIVLVLKNIFSYNGIVDILWLNLIPLAAFLFVSLKKAIIFSVFGFFAMLSLGYHYSEFASLDAMKGAAEYYIFFAALLYLLGKSRSDAWEAVRKYTSSLELDLQKALDKERIQNKALLKMNEELRDTGDRLQNFNEKLEERVQEKTLALEESNYELQLYVKDLMELNASLQKAKAAALQAAQARSNFISGISHELRTPLNAIINFTDQVIEDFETMLTDQKTQKESYHYLERVMVNSRHLLQLINDLLEFTKAEAGKIDYDMQVHDLNEIIQNAYNNTYSLIVGQEVALKLRLSIEPVMALVDKRRFLQILLNLLSNAIKFTQKGHIEIRSYELGDEVKIEIEDTGCGIAQHKQASIFDPFVQANSHDHGTGLGLGLVKHMCRDMNIEISFRSVETMGTTFYLSLKKVATD